MSFFYADQVSGYIRQTLDDNKSALGLNFVGLADEMVPEYPAALVLAGLVTRELKGTRQWKVEFRVGITVIHADVTEDRATRTMQDIELANNVVKHLHADMTLDQNIIHGFVEADTPGVIEGPSRTMIATLISWYGLNTQMFTEGG